MKHDDSSSHLIEGISNEVLFAVIFIMVMIFAIYILLKMYRSSNTIHPSHLDHVQAIRQRVLENRDENDPPRRSHRSEDNRCPICIDNLNFAVETNCGHVFCCTCIVSYWEHGTWVAAMNCPVCRQEIRVLLPDFTHEEEVSDELIQLTTKIQQYNRRFSGEPRPLMDYIYDFPVLLRHMVRNFFSAGGLVTVLRFRIVVYLLIVFLYILSPLDIIPEIVFGILGFIDDLAIAAVILLYLTVLFRQSLAN